MKTNFTKTQFASLAFALTGALLLAPVGCSTAPNTPEGMSALETQARATAARIENNVPTPMDQAAGYVVFPDIGEGAVGIGGAYGKGVVFEKGTVVGYADMTAGTLGWQLGGQSFKEIIVFYDVQSLQALKEGRLEFDAKAHAVAGSAAGSAVARTLPGATVYTLDKDGLMFAAAVGGQKFNYIPKT